jgi:hypothetical protein
MLYLNNPLQNAAANVSPGKLLLLSGLHPYLEDGAANQRLTKLFLRRHHRDHLLLHRRDHLLLHRRDHLLHHHASIVLI